MAAVLPPSEALKDKPEAVMEEDAHDGGEDEDEDIEEGEEEDEEEEEGEDFVTHGRRSGRGLTLMTLLKEKVLEPGLGNMTINYLGNKFKGDLLGDGRIRSQETGKVFGTPSAWAIYCKQIVNPNKKSGCGWASVKYRGKKLDEYKNNWNRQKRLEYEREGDDMECGHEVEEGGSCSESEAGENHDHEILEFDMLHTRHDPPYAGNPLVELTSFSSQGRLQPFTVAVSSSAMAVIDLHVHLTRAEALGFLAGQWDVNNHNLIVSHAFPLCVEVTPGDPTEAPQQTASPAGVAAEAAIHRQMASLKLALVGWYHSHPHSAPLPSLRDIDAQLDYEMKMKGTNDASYTPCVAFVVAPFNDTNGRSLNRVSSSASTNASSAHIVSSTTVTTSSTSTPSVNCSNSVARAVDLKTGDSTTVTTGQSTVTTVTTCNQDTKPSSTINSNDCKEVSSNAAQNFVTPGESSTATATTTSNNVTPMETSTTNAVSRIPSTIPSSVGPVVSGRKSSAHKSDSPLVFGLTAMNAFWAMPPPEHRPHEYPRPMSIIYNVVQDAFVPKEALIHMRECVKFYSKNEDAICLSDPFAGTLTYWDKLKMAIKARVPKDHYLPLIEYLHKILRIRAPLPELLRPPSPAPVKESPKEKTSLDLLGSDSHPAARPCSPSSSGVGSLSSVSLSALVLKGREAGVDITSVRAPSSGSSRAALASSTALSETRSRPYPDPSKIHPLLVDRSDERTLQPLLLDRAPKSGLIHPLLSDQPSDKATVHQIISSEQHDSSKHPTSRACNSPGIPLPASQNPPDYPFPLLRGMMVEQASTIQKQQEQRCETDVQTLQKDKHGIKALSKLEANLPLIEKDLLMQMNEKYLLQQQRMQIQQEQQFNSKTDLLKSKMSTEAKVQSVASLFPQLSASVSVRSEPNPPAYSTSHLSKEGDQQARRSPPPYPSFSKHRDLSIFPTPVTNKNDPPKKDFKDFSARSTVPSTIPSSGTISFSPVNLLSSNSSTPSGSNDNGSAGTHKATMSASASGSPSSTLSASSIFSNSPSFSITAVSRASPVGFPAHLAPLSSPSLTITSQSSGLSSSPISLPGLSPAGVNAALYPTAAGGVGAPSASPSPLASGLPPPLSPSPISFNPPRNSSPSLQAASVEVSPRHTEWAQNALPGMARPPLISVKSQAALSQAPYTHVPPVVSTNSSPATVNASEITTFSADGVRNSAAESIFTQAKFAEALSSGTVSPDRWMQASLAGFPQFPSFSGFGKTPPQYGGEGQHFPPPQYRPHGGALSFLPPTSEQQQQELRK